MKWIRARLREKSTWAGLVLVAGAIAAGPLGFAYTDLKDAVLILLGGGALIATPDHNGDCK